MGVPNLEHRFSFVDVTVDLASVASLSTATQTVTVSGVKTTDMITMSVVATLTAGITMSHAFASAADTVTLQYANVTGVAVDAASTTFRFGVFRPESKIGSTLIMP